MNAVVYKEKRETIQTLQPVSAGGRVPQSGTRLGRYRLQKALKQGGMADVYLAYDEYTGRAVAIKLVHEQNANIALFSREIRIMRALRHPHILPLLDAGQWGGYWYLVTPYIAGGTLQDRLEQGPLTLEEAGFVLERLGEAVQYMHEAGIIHCDIKPANVLIDEASHIYLADFGIATLEGESSKWHGRVMGTPVYMAPEAISGTVSRQSDIYALGVLLFEMLTGQVPFDGTDAYEICTRHLHEEPAKPSLFNACLPRAVDRVVLRMLEKDPEERFATPLVAVDAYADACNSLTLFEYTRQAFSTMVGDLKSHYETMRYARLRVRECGPVPVV